MKKEKQTFGLAGWKAQYLPKQYIIWPIFSDNYKDKRE
jgi:hypothetical protein